MKSIGLRLKRNPMGEKIYQGVYDYHRGNNTYSEEEFLVYRDNSALSLSFFSLMHARVATGELLKVYVDYTVSKDYTPQKVLIEKTLGKRQISEVYQYDKVKSRIGYFFISQKGKKHSEIPITSNFHITTPTTVTSMLFLKPQKDKSMGKNFYSLFTCHNQWEFASAPKAQSVIIQRKHLGTSKLKIGEEYVSSAVYNLYENAASGAVTPEMPSIEVYMSRYVNIPYMLKTKDGLHIRARNITNFNKE